MGNDNSALKEEKVRSDERAKSASEALQQEREFRDYLETLERERREERIAEQEKREQTERDFKEILETEKKRLEVERGEREQQNKEEEQKAREQQVAQQRAKERLEEDLRNEINRRRERVKSLKPGDTLKLSQLKCPDILNIGFFGTTGVGKTSLINSLTFAIEGALDETNMEQASTEDFHGGHTVRRLRIGVTDHIALIDNRGVGEEDLIRDQSVKELISQLEGRGSFTREVDWRHGKLWRKKEKEEERIYCTVLVFDARKAQSYYKVVGEFVNTLKEWQGRFPVSVITNVDRVKPEDLEALHLILRSAGISDYYDIENVTKESMILKEEYQLSLLKLMERCIKDGDRIFELRSKIEGRKGKK